MTEDLETRTYEERLRDLRMASLDTAGKTCVHWNYTKASLQAPPLDFSFRGISFMQDLLTEEPRPGLRAILCSEGGRLLTQAVRLNNNTLSDLTDFPDIMEKLLEYPLDIYWIDLSFNDLPSIDPVREATTGRPL
ncbi:leucine-rich repeat-containing protein 51-like [Protobothrops mucrosquamatus]|uniref:leucine-rich repeat-containing protein 51-like n=1 Tax=Protobothrops mucrosquamatus TaxID=103944 RepID=UPI0007757E33|nr:leucine-rich repeat-containing protein 51-like [Protobothrops mucrosquamatus]